MVNVLSRVPFNLRNDPQSGQANTSSPSRSNRSISVNLNRPAIRALDANDASSRASSPKPSPSISRSESASSIHHASSSHISTTDDFDHEPILKARLVSTPKNKARVFSRRGRSKTRQSRFTEDGSPVDSTPILEGIQSVDSGRGGTEHQGHGGDFGDLHQASTLPEGEGPEVKQLSEEDKAVVRHPLSPSLIVRLSTFKLHRLNQSRMISQPVFKMASKFRMLERLLAVGVTDEIYYQARRDLVHDSQIVLL